MLPRLASLSLIAALLSLGGCYHYHDRDDGWRDRDHRPHHRYDRDDDRRAYRDRDYR
ncbi:hypothetical protein ACNFIC_00620 [Pseudomonas sp. NY15463]|uniref:hypothetical protein n=1 Tax=Pseudomonas sp. NY15463 TaxID=3400361 RepID=UPI003A859C66